MDKKDNICICLPVYNGEKHLSAALDSLLSQTLRDFILIILNDGSTDGTPRIIQEYAARDNRIRAYSNPEKTGINPAWKKVVQIADQEFHADYFAWFSDHDLVERDWLEKLHRALQENPGLACAWARTVFINESDSVLDEPSYGDHFFETLAPQATVQSSDPRHFWRRLELATLGLFGAGSVVYGLFRMDMVKKCKIFREELLPDLLLLSELALHGDIQCVKDTTFFRRHFEMTKQERIARQLRNNFSESGQQMTPFFSFATVLLREALDVAPKLPPKDRFARILHGLLFFICVAENQFQFEHLKAERSQVFQTHREFSFLTDWIEAHDGLPFVSRWKYLALQRRKEFHDTKTSLEVKELREKYAQFRELKKRYARLKSMHDKQTMELNALTSRYRYARYLGPLGAGVRKLLDSRGPKRNGETVKKDRPTAIEEDTSPAPERSQS
jgi:glycosyltransferase involved in cell wall biosynthesis